MLPLSRNQTRVFFTSCAHTNSMLGFLVPFSGLACGVACLAVLWCLARKIVTKYRKENYFHRAMLLKAISSYYKA